MLCEVTVWIRPITDERPVINIEEIKEEDITDYDGSWWIKNRPGYGQKLLAIKKEDAEFLIGPMFLEERSGPPAYQFYVNAIDMTECKKRINAVLVYHAYKLLEAHQDD